VTLPFTNALTMEMPEMLATVPMSAVRTTCGWCDIKLTAIPDAPREWEGEHYHPGGCIAAARGAARGERRP